MNSYPVRGPGRPLPGPYALARLSDRCPTCRADPYEHCVRGDGQTRRIPCLARMYCRQAATDGYQ